ncbi:MAG: N-acetylmuramoyl-L-alanine amidase [Luteolibacter sp.]|uniref:peptidoglycan recognition protein family protein n=1 Tax=Luteolibacter sp. TaxID=1962973 RepID=UPI003267B77E
MKSIFRIIPSVILVFASLQCSPIGPPGGGRDRYQTYQPQAASKPELVTLSGNGRMSTSAMLRQVNLKVDMVRKGTYGRRSARSMTPRYITIHSTQNYTAGAEKHSEALKHGALRTGQRPGYLIWHFTVEDRIAIQHMPTSEQGIHADFDGPGNHMSIGIEMCENRGNNRSRTIEHTAMLTAVLMKRNNIPLANVVPHYHWPRRGKHPPNKDCPHFLMDNGRPGSKWRWFQSRVDYYYRQLNG